MMKNNKSIQWRCGLVVSLVLGVTSCSMDMNNPQSQEVVAVNPMPVTQNAQAQQVQKNYSSKDPVQQSTPGPKRAAAPQIPVIQ